MTIALHEIRGRAFRALLAASMILAAAFAQGEVPVRADNARIGWVPGWVPHPGFFELVNEGDRSVTVTGARSNGFARIEFKAPEDGDLFMNEPMDMPVTLGPGDRLTFEPGGGFLMMFTQATRLEPGEEVVIEFLFRERPPLPVEFTVRKMKSR